MTGPDLSLADRLLRQPGLQRVPSGKLELFILRDFLPPDLCEALIALVEARRRPSELANHDGDPNFRTSETCDLDAAEPAVTALEAKLFALNAIDPALGEPVQGQRYLAGQEFKSHVDWFSPTGRDWERYCGISGQRTWTFMVYLNDVAAGGATRFNAIGKIIQPERGKLVAWNNRTADGGGNKATFHQGMKVRAGAKYVITKWYRERPWG
ncbi:prolyl hydroxylase family protein [Novosphingobium album (ex Liu et al. 2023)]|uniref:2OG-Fe(II) oxygenase n=1 Tax=Novosphingobium album (ex Liu et al. 2023) TaxID=3031130 RepID=A0ABT5WST8_9SPHN|nr:2OG-Fe(II) oxygenase [Novosphingobium album (ex Liu et al. 2023)]MDE8652063.1 2OG-Fe(II) oxygenase [Novosphingobium album (ex Liu et al. 2023)]